MAIYRFRVTFEDYDDIIREIDVLSTHTFLDLHHAIQQSTGYNPDLPSSFFISNDQWMKGEEIAYLPNARKQERGIALMENSKLNKFIDDPHQKFYYTYNFERPYDFHVQLIKILKEESGKKYPLTFKTVGAAPKPFGAAAIPTEENGDKKAEKDDYDFLNETEYGIDDAEELDLDLMDDEETQGGEDDKDEFSTGFSDNENYEDDY
ncbi:hypothetical protein H8S90_12890 [Olivibacter sp. SDN3]|uniref:IS1096 element passenger TnpR family protein n=1 Tax=Olivibacter sp. SDN3 TaxID=2764720 RepID=UPI001651861B|nr:hypothetical protein [Olivibacter sp. SDN3]QNL47722.1 hypothetical protein H8S90_12890 [Olivibacter sp. SDN3]